MSSPTVLLQINEQYYSIEPIPGKFRFSYKFPKSNIVQNNVHYDEVNSTADRKRIGHFLDGPVEFIIFWERFDDAKVAFRECMNIVVSSENFLHNGGKKIGSTIGPYGKLTGPIVAHIDQGIVIGIANQTAFGHLLRDGIIPLLLVPKDIMENSVIICKEIMVPLITEVLPAIGFRVGNDLFCNLEFPECVYVDKLYTVVAEHFRLNVPGLSHIRLFVKRVKEYFGISKVEATKYVIMNRPPDKPRHIIGFEGLCSAIASKYPNINWIVRKSHEERISDQFAFWSGVKFIISPCGSNLLLIIFMNPGGVLVYFRDPSYADVGNNCAAIASHIWALSVPYHGWECKHLALDNKKTPIDMCTAMEFIGHGFFVLEHQKWPSAFSIKKKITPLGKDYGIYYRSLRNTKSFIDTYWKELHKYGTECPASSDYFPNPEL